MGLSRQYLRYGSTGVCNIVGNSFCNACYVDGHVCAVGACADVFLWNIRQSEKVCILYGEKFMVTAICPSRDKLSLAIGYDDGSIKIFRSDQAEKPQMVFTGHRSAVTVLEYDWTALRLASGAKDCVVILWDIVNECGLYRLSGHKGPITRLAFTKEHNLLLSSAKDTFLKFWDLSSQHCFYTLPGYKSEIWDFLLLQNDRRLIVGSTEAELRIYDLSYFEHGRVIKPEVTDFSDDVKKLRLDTSESTVDDLNNQANDILRCEKAGSLLRHLKGRVTGLHISADERVLFITAPGSLVEAFLVYTPDETQSKIQKRVRKAKRKETAGDATAFEQSVRTDMSTQFLRLGEHRLSAKVTSLSVWQRKSGYKVLFLLANNSLEEFSVTLDGKQAAFSPLASVVGPGHRSDIRTLAFSTDNSSFLSGSQESVKLWNRASGVCVRTIPCEMATSSLFVTGDRHCVVGTKQGNLTLCDLSASEVVANVSAHDASVTCLSASQDQRGFVSGSVDKQVKFWQFDVTNDSEKKALTLVHTKTLKLSDDVMCVKLSENGKFVAVGLLDNTAKVFFVDTLKFFLSLYGHSLPVLCLDISSDSSIVVTGSADKNVKIWGLDFGDCHRSLFAHDDSVTCVQFVPKTHLFFSAGKDGLVKQWDADKFEKVQVLEGHHGEIWALAVSLNGNYVVTAAHDKSIRMWEKTLEPLILHEEQEMEREKDADDAVVEQEDVIPGERPGEADLAGKKTVETVKSAENILEALDICRKEIVECQDNPQRTENDKHPLIRAYGSPSLECFVLDVIRKIRSNNLEKSLLVIPYADALELLQYLADCMDRCYELELACRCAFFLVRIHHAQLTSSAAAERVLDRLRTTTRQKVAVTRDLIGFNLAGLRLLELDFAESEDARLFAEVADTAKAKKRARKLREKQAFLMKL